MKKRAYLVVSMLAGLHYADACTTIIVGKNATNDGSILVARNVDGSNGNAAVHFIYHPPRKAGYLYTNVEENKFTYQLPNNLLGYSGAPDWQTNNKSFEEAGFNDLGVGISATETIQSNLATLKVDPYVEESGIVEEAIPTILLPQITSARQGVEMLGKIIETSGSGEGFGVAFVDKNEAWYLENAGGHQWLAVRIPDDKYFISANQSRLGEVDLSDSRNYLASAGLIGFAREHGLYNPAQGAFNFHKVYGENNAEDVIYNYPRVAYLQGKYTAKTLAQPIRDGNYPVFLHPDHKLSLLDIESGLQSYFQGAPHDPYSSQNPAATARPIAVYRTQQSHILQLRNNLPLALANVEYLNLGMTTLGIYLPFYQGAKIPASYALGSDQADDNSAYWKFRKLQALAMLNFPKYAPWVQSRFASLNAKILSAQAILEQKYLKIYRQDPAAAQQLLDDFTQQTVLEAFQAASELSNQIITDKSLEISKTYGFHGS